jgi:hypothetical protein
VVLNGLRGVGNGFDSPEDWARLLRGMITEVHKSSAVAPILMLPSASTWLRRSLSWLSEFAPMTLPLSVRVSLRRQTGWEPKT